MEESETNSRPKRKRIDKKEAGLVYKWINEEDSPKDESSSADAPENKDHSQEE